MVKGHPAYIRMFIQWPERNYAAVNFRFTATTSDDLMRLLGRIRQYMGAVSNGFSKISMEIADDKMAHELSMNRSAYSTAHRNIAPISVLEEAMGDDPLNPVKPARVLLDELFPREAPYEVII